LEDVVEKWEKWGRRDEVDARDTRCCFFGVSISKSKTARKLMVAKGFARISTFPVTTVTATSIVLLLSLFLRAVSAKSFEVVQVWISGRVLGEQATANATALAHA
jgi:hypothetical protein